MASCTTPRRKRGPRPDTLTFVDREEGDEGRSGARNHGDAGGKGGECSQLVAVVISFR